MIAAGLVLTFAAVSTSAFGLSLLVRASLSESRGELLLARRLARTGGFFLAAGCAGQALSGPLLSVRPVLGIFAVASVLAAGFTGLLAGLSGKPRPSGHVAALLWFGSLVLGLLAMGVPYCSRC